jgi:hypothetical protein
MKSEVVFSLADWLVPKQLKSEHYKGPGIVSSFIVNGRDKL